MTLNLTIPQMSHTDFTPRITVIGVGGGGTNAVDNMIAANLQGVEFVVANTDAQQLMHSRADRRIQLGPHITQGLGAGAKPEIGKAAAEEASDELYRHLDGAHMVFITAGMGGGTGTGAAPVIARMARERNILTVGVVTKPFGFEGIRRARAADQGIEELQQYVDTLIVIPNQNLFRMANERTTWRDAFKMADQVLYMGVRGVTDLMMVHGLVNLDFADIRTVMAEMGKAMMGTGEAEGENRAIKAAEAAINNPLLEDTSMSGARGLLINITGGEDLTLFEVDEAANRIRQEVDEEANVIFGSAVDESLEGRIRVSVVATGIDSQKLAEQARPKLVAVGGGAAPAPQPILVRSAAPAAAPVPGVAQASTPSPLRHASPPPETMGNAAMALDPQPIQVAPQPRPLRPPQAQPQPIVQPASRASLFADGPRPVAVPSSQPPAFNAADGSKTSLFNTVTGAFRRRATPSVAPIGQAQPVRREPAMDDYQAEPAPMPARANAGTEDPGIEIPAFLRRQTS
ncbi:cell division protein FtsZ [Rhodopila globiformis]|uniref:Cell division protein FtsZ n=1 Tax=Rhodopila globiformis TaxID=1071 RepID=A0A2S6MWR9_RHOGL|nr:cell division protein FtsZ [Rhodopila globiformis]PPQ26813.1 cell division protein FtsZ [Rhodopila globiformis]